MARYDNEMDAECVPLCDAINSIGGLTTVESCCGHGEKPFCVFFNVASLEKLPVLLYYLSPCHIGFKWDCKAYTGCSGKTARFYIESRSIGEEAYREANLIAEKIREALA